MAIPKVFVSSTCYDLRQIREDLRTFIISLGYEPRLSEYHEVAYNATQSLETDCYTEVSLCDIVVGIIGGKFGSESRAEGKSISMREMEVAIEKNKQIYIFIVRDVDSEFRTYVANKDKEVTYVSVDDVRIFEYIQTLRAQPDIVINSFATAGDITQCLKAQWAGLFQTYLNNKERFHGQEETIRISQLTEVLGKTSSQFQMLLDDYRNSIPTIQYAKAFINPVHVAFRKTLLSDAHPLIYFKNIVELEAFLDSFGFVKSSSTSEEQTYQNEKYSFAIKAGIVFNEDGTTKYIDNYKLEKYRMEGEPIFELTPIQGFTQVDDDELPF